MFSFENDYSEGCCPKVLKALTKTNFLQASGYGVDEFCENAKQLIRENVNNNDVDVHFVPGGTPCNILAASVLKSYESIICAENGHINTHEAGAVEATGHKIIATRAINGKVDVQEVIRACNEYNNEHYTKPSMVFISNPTEFGTIYTKQELIDLALTCKKLGLYLYMDGARLGNALVAKGNDLSLADICSYTDMFYIGGTKNGALYGEAFVIKNTNLKTNFRYALKQRGMMMAKSRIMGVQFEALFTDNVYFENAKQANLTAQTLKIIFKHYGIDMYIDSPTNQIFPIIENGLLERIQTEYVVSPWAKYDDDHTVVRFCCSWNTKSKDIKDFLTFLKQNIY